MQIRSYTSKVGLLNFKTLVFACNAMLHHTTVFQSYEQMFDHKSLTVFVPGYELLARIVSICRVNVLQTTKSMT